MKYAIRAPAERDIDEAADWYREHALDPLVAVRFLLEIRAVFEMISTGSAGPFQFADSGTIDSSVEDTGAYEAAAPACSGVASPCQ